MKLHIPGVGSIPATASTEAAVTLRVPALERPGKTSDLHLSLVRRRYISHDAGNAERHDAI
jgi:hypothetical protein